MSGCTITKVDLLMGAVYNIFANMLIETKMSDKSILNTKHIGKTQKDKIKTKEWRPKTSHHGTCTWLQPWLHLIYNLYMLSFFHFFNLDLVMLFIIWYLCYRLMNYGCGRSSTFFNPNKHAQCDEVRLF